MGYSKRCKICDCAFVGKGPAAMYCEVHQQQAKQIQRRKNALRVAKLRAERGDIKQPGAGKGGNPLTGADHQNYRHGWYMADTLRVRKKAECRYCERCHLDLLDVSRWHWVVHHKDHNHFNNDYSNLELLCKRCHQIEHECHLAFDKGATTRAKARTLK